MDEHVVSETVIAPVAKTTPAHAGFIKNNLRDYGMLISLVAIMALFQVLTDGTLLRPLNLTNLVLQNSYIVIMALGMLLVIVAGHIDLSVGSVCGFIGALAAVLMVSLQWHFIPTTIACLVAGAAIGGAPRGVVAPARLPALLVTPARLPPVQGPDPAPLHGPASR